ncbi:helicase-related protein [Gracilibacillus sp. S3-1-1]|uniref:Helicase-related protein n=1 Tax=Gracilibacillus pellucidus TaxID=3095368 RepID=A0ACC6M1I5_9BACI|nr:DEAD/DEAH box helicase family protein [Gracilibacillus sp. S3-1-1]MDX8044592.1 helicase-related protein [Gracilibacillus sp. S3-1-1]
MNFAQLLAGKLLLSSEVPLQQATISYLLRTNQLTQLPSITKKYGKPECRRCGNKDAQLFAKIPCARCDTTHVYCRNCVQTGRVLACDPLLVWHGIEPTYQKQKEPCRWNGTLTPAQDKAATAIIEVIDHPKAELIIWAVCGAGKTEMLFPAITKAIQQAKRICIATPRADVVRELLPRFKRAFPDTEMEALYANSPDKTGRGQLVISTTHQLIRYQAAFDLMIIDEIDAFPYHHDKTLPLLTKRASKASATSIYLTATPRKEHRAKIRRKQLAVQFVPIRFHGHPLPVPQLKIEFQLRKKLQQNNQSTALTQFIQSRSSKRQLLIFAPTIELVEKVSKQYNAISVHAADPDRKEKVNQFRQKKIDTLVTTTILERGVTFPSVDVVILGAGHHVFDEAAIVQIAGRAGRSPDDPTGEVLLIHQGKTNAMEDAIAQIKMMNRKGKNQ